MFKLNHNSEINQRQIKVSPVFTKRETRPRVYRFLLVPRVTGLGVGVFDTLSDSIQYLNFAQKMINSIFNLILLYSRFNSKYC